MSSWEVLRNRLRDAARERAAQQTAAAPIPRKTRPERVRQLPRAPRSLGPGIAQANRLITDICERLPSDRVQDHRFRVAVERRRDADWDDPSIVRVVPEDDVAPGAARGTHRVIYFDRSCTSETVRPAIEKWLRATDRP